MLVVNVGGGSSKTSSACKVVRHAKKPNMGNLLKMTWDDLEYGSCACTALLWEAEGPESNDSHGACNTLLFCKRCRL
jgi:hypothetical protein